MQSPDIPGADDRTSERHVDPSSRRQVSFAGGCIRRRVAGRASPPRRSLARTPAQRIDGFHRAGWIVRGLRRSMSRINAAAADSG